MIKPIAAVCFIILDIRNWRASLHSLHSSILNYLSQISHLSLVNKKTIETFCGTNQRSCYLSMESKGRFWRYWFHWVIILNKEQSFHFKIQIVVVTAGSKSNEMNFQNFEFSSNPKLISKKTIFNKTWKSTTYWVFI